MLFKSNSKGKASHMKLNHDANPRNVERQAPRMVWGTKSILFVINHATLLYAIL